MNPPLDRTPPAPTRERTRSQTAARSSRSGAQGREPRRERDDDPRRSIDQRRARESGERREPRAARIDPLERSERLDQPERSRTRDGRAPQVVQVSSSTARGNDRNGRDHRDPHDRYDRETRGARLDAGSARHPGARMPRPANDHRADRRPLLVAGVAATLLCAFIATRGDGAGDIVTPAVAAAQDVSTDVGLPASALAATPAVAATDPAVTDPAAAVTGDAAVAAVAIVADGDPGADGTVTDGDSCLMDVLSLRIGESGESVTCLQQALTEQGYFTGTISGSFDQATFAAVEALQTDRNLYVDGVVGRESALSLGIWPDEESFVTRTPPPAPGAVDLEGYRLSSVASAGGDAPALPENSGSGRRLVYDRAGQRVWAVNSEGEIVRSWLVSGSQYSNELPGTHEVYSKSDMSTAWNGKAWLPKMVRWLKTERGAIGFHSIPLHVEDDSPYQTDAELGTRLSGGCQRQAVLDADFVWEWADIGTKVVVI